MSLSNKIIGEEQAGVKVKKFNFQAFADTDPTQEQIKNASKFIFTSFDKDEENQAVQKTLAEAELEAKYIRDNAKAEAERMLAEAGAELEQARQLKADAAEEGHAEGIKAGLEEGRKQGREAFDAQAAPALEALSKIQGLYEDLWQINEASMVKLAVKIAERIIFEELKTSPELILQAFQAAVDQLNQQHRALFRLNPEDLALLETAGEQLRGRISGLVKIDLESDSSLKRGELVMETESGRLDATLKRRIEAVTASVNQALQQEFVDLDW
jgi:flagellar assembly protein FliH